jgi:alanine dehydrogenase
VQTVFSDPHNVRTFLARADLVVGAVLIPGAKAPRLVTREQLKQMPNGSVIVDVAIDQGGCIETSRPTTHADPTYVVEGVVHYCVTNMPGAVGRTSTIALCAADDPGFGEGINMVGGRVTNSAVAHSLHLPHQPMRPRAA